MDDLGLEAYSDINAVAEDSNLLTLGGNCYTETEILDTGLDCLGNSSLGANFGAIPLRSDLLVAGDTPVLTLSGDSSDSGLLAATYGVEALERTL